MKPPWATTSTPRSNPAGHGETGGVPSESFRLRFSAELPLEPEAPSPLELDLPCGPVLERLTALRQFGDPRMMVSSWAILCARLLGLGWVGPAFGADSLTVPRGLKSCRALHRLEQYVELDQAVWAIEETLLSLARGVARLLDCEPAQTLEPLRAEVYGHCLEQIQQGFLLPPPLSQAVLPRPAFDRIVDELRR